jgi:glycolate oxidase
MLDDIARRGFDRALGPENVISDPARLRSYECDGLTGYRVVPAPGCRAGRCRWPTGW